MLFAPLQGWRAVRVIERRTAQHFAEVVRWLVEDLYPNAEQVVRVADNLNTPTPAALYTVFAPEQARRIAERLEWHYTPKHGSWLNRAEIELSVLFRQCLDRRIDAQAELQRVVATWEAKRNARGVVAQWRFTTADARVKLHRLYPSLQ